MRGRIEGKSLTSNSLYWIDPISHGQEKKKKKHLLGCLVSILLFHLPLSIAVVKPRGERAKKKRFR
jgi:hypothetical protein